MTSERRPGSTGGSGKSSGRRPRGSQRNTSQPQRSGRVSKSGRSLPEEDEDAAAPMLKKVMFIGTVILVPLLLGLLIWRGTREEPKPPEKPQVIRHDKILEEVAQIGTKAAQQFAEAMKLEDGDDAKIKGIRQAKETLAAAQEKLDDLNGRPEYQGEDYEQVFEPMRNRMGQEMKAYHEALKRAMK